MTLDELIADCRSLPNDMLWHRHLRYPTSAYEVRIAWRSMLAAEEGDRLPHDPAVLHVYRPAYRYIGGGEDRQAVLPERLWNDAVRRGTMKLRRKLGRVDSRPLTFAEAREIRAAYWDGLATAGDLARQYGLVRETVSRLIHCHIHWYVL